MQPTSKRNRNPHTGAPRGGAQSGSALLIAVFVLALLSAAGVSLLFLTQTEVRMSKGSLRAKRAFYTAEAGEEAGRTALWLANGQDDFTDDLQSYAGGNDLFDFDPDNLQIIYDAAGNVTGLGGFGDDVPLIGVTPFAGGWYAAFVTNDPDEGVTTTTDGNQLVMITGVGGGVDRSLEVVQAIVRRREFLEQLPPATITLLGPSPDFFGGHADVHDYSGDDCGLSGSGIPNYYVPVVGTMGSEAEEAAEEGIYVDSLTGDGPNYESGPYRDEETFVDLTDPSDPLLTDGDYTGTDPAWSDCEALHEFVEDLRSVADVVCCNEPVCGSTSACPVPAQQLTNVIFVDGNHEVGPEGGSGTLVVTGELLYDGKASWEGTIFVLGAGRMRRNGAGNGIISGAVLVADIAGPDGIYGNEDDCSGGDDGFDEVYFDLRGGGNADTQYCSADILANRPNPPYRIVNFRQL